MLFKNVSISPLVLVSVVDHYKRLSTPRVVGILLGATSQNGVSVTNSFAIPFEESVEGIFIDTSYLQNMFDLYYKVNAKEEIIGWYHSGPNLCKSDAEISKLIMRYCNSPILAVINVHMDNSEIPCQAFQLGIDGSLVRMNAEIQADETEEVGVEHLLRDIKECTGSSIKDKVKVIEESLRTYEKSLGVIVDYLEKVQQGKKKRNYNILKLLQDVLNSVPRYEEEVDLNKVYVASLVDTFIQMIDLEKNKDERDEWC